MVRFFEARQELEEDGEGSFFGEFFFFCEEVSQGFAWDELHDQVELSARVDAVVKDCDCVGVLEAADELGFFLEVSGVSFCPLRVGLVLALCVEDFNGHRAVHGDMGRAKDDAKSADADGLFDAVFLRDNSAWLDFGAHRWGSPFSQAKVLLANGR